MDVIAVVAKTPFSAAGIVLGWLPLLLLSLAARRCTKRLLPLELCWWFASFLGLALSTSMNYSMLDRPWQVEFEASSPLTAFIHGALVTAIVSVIWPLMWGFGLFWFSYVPEMQAKILWEIALAAACAALFSVLATGALRLGDRRLANLRSLA